MCVLVQKLNMCHKNVTKCHKMWRKCYDLQWAGKTECVSWKCDEMTQNVMKMLCCRNDIKTKWGNLAEMEVEWTLVVYDFVGGEVGVVVFVVDLG